MSVWSHWGTLGSLGWSRSGPDQFAGYIHAVSVPAAGSEVVCQPFALRQPPVTSKRVSEVWTPSRSESHIHRIMMQGPWCSGGSAHGGRLGGGCPVLRPTRITRTQSQWSLQLGALFTRMQSLRDVAGYSAGRGLCLAVGVTHWFQLGPLVRARGDWEGCVGLEVQGFGCGVSLRERSGANG